MDLYLKLAFDELSQNDGLVVMGHGLGLRKLFSKFVQFYCETSTQKKALVFCLNGNDLFDFTSHSISRSPNSSSNLPKVFECML